MDPRDPREIRKYEESLVANGFMSIYEMTPGTESMENIVAQRQTQPGETSYLSVANSNPYIPKPTFRDVLEQRSHTVNYFPAVTLQAAEPTPRLMRKHHSESDLTEQYYFPTRGDSSNLPEVQNVIHASAIGARKRCEYLPAGPSSTLATGATKVTESVSAELSSALSTAGSNFTEPGSIGSSSISPFEANKATDSVSAGPSHVFPRYTSRFLEAPSTRSSLQMITPPRMIAGSMPIAPWSTARKYRQATPTSGLSSRRPHVPTPLTLSKNNAVFVNKGDTDDEIPEMVKAAMRPHSFKKLFGKKGMLLRGDQEVTAGPGPTESTASKFKQLLYEASDAFNNLDVNTIKFPLPWRNQSIPGPGIVDLTTSVGSYSQSVVYAQLEWVLMHELTGFLMTQNNLRLISQESLDHVNKLWMHRNRPQVPAFQYDLFFQYELVIRNIHTVTLHGFKRGIGRNNNYGGKVLTFMAEWKKLIDEIYVRTNARTDAVIKGHIYGVGRILYHIDAPRMATDFLRGLRRGIDDDIRDTKRYLAGRK